MLNVRVRGEINAAGELGFTPLKCKWPRRATKVPQGEQEKTEAPEKAGLWGNARTKSPADIETSGGFLHAHI